MVTKLKFPLDKVNEFLEACNKLSATSTDHLSTAEYIKCEIEFGECFLTKNNIECFIEYKFDIEQEDIQFLLHEKKLRDFCNTIKGEYLYISIDDSKTMDIKISDSEKMKDSKKLSYNSEGIDISKFPKTPKTESQRTRIPEATIQSIILASKYTTSDGIKPNFTCIYLGSFVKEPTMMLTEGNEIFASDGLALFYHKTFEQKFQPIAIQSKEVKILNGLKFCDYVVAQSHNIYYVPGSKIVFGFRHIDNTGGFSYDHFLSMSTKENSITIKVSDVMLFCTRVKNSSTGATFKNSLCVVDKPSKIAKLIYANHDSNDEDVKECELSEVKGDISRFIINQSQVYDILRFLPYDIITISEEQWYLSVTTSEDDKFFSFFAKITEL